MATGILTAAFREFEVALDELASNANFVCTASRIRPRVGKMLHWDLLDPDAKALAKSFMEQRGVEEPLIYRGLVILLSGAFEHFVRRIVREVVVAINKAFPDFDGLHAHIQEENAYRTGVALQTIYEPPDHLDLDYERLAANIGTCIRGSKQFTLNAEAFTVFMTIISPKKLVEAFHRVGVELRWDDLGKLPALRQVLDKRDTRETANAVQEFLRTFGQTRNKIAHTGSGGVAITATEFEQLLKVLRVFAQSLCAVIECELAKHCKVR